MNSCFTFSLDYRAKFISVIFTCLMLGLIVASFTLGYSPYKALIIGLGALLCLGLAYAYAPKSAQLSGDALTIQKRCFKKIIPYSSITNVRYLQPADLGRLWRLWGSGGAFGYFGVYNSNKLGRFILYATHSKDYVLVEADKKYVITPDNALGFVTELKERVGAAQKSSLV